MRSNRIRVKHRHKYNYEKKQNNLNFRCNSHNLIVVLIILFTNNTEDTLQSIRKSPDINLLVGDWVRTDASYLIKINKVNMDGALESQYFNPKPINVGKANWEESHGSLKITVELRDVNYPGSTYTLGYLPDRNILKGNYYQAAQGLSFYVEFIKKKY